MIKPLKNKVLIKRENTESGNPLGVVSADRDEYIVKAIGKGVTEVKKGDSVMFQDGMIESPTKNGEGIIDKTQIVAIIK